MLQFNFTDVAMLLGCTPLAMPGSIRGLSIDSRSIQPGQLFVAVRGEERDGHDFLEMAKAKGAAAALVDHPMRVDLPQFLVKDTVLAMGALAKAWRSRFSLPIIALTGSNGKTTTKNMIASILAAEIGQAEYVLATQGNLNNHLGLPLMLAQLNASHRYAVIEMGMNHFSEIAYLTQLTEPEIALITNAGPCHLQGVESVAGVAKAKAEIFSGLPSTKGSVVLNRDDEFYPYWKKCVAHLQIITFGLHTEADVRADYLPGQPLRIQTPLGEIDVQLPVLGKHNVLNALAATASVLPLSVALSSVQQGLETLQPARGRLNVHQLHDQGAYVLDDSYNANPLSLQAAVETMNLFSGKKIVVLGDLKELGKQEVPIHCELGESLRASGVDYLFTYGCLTEHTSAMFGEGAFHFSDREKLILALQPLIHSETVILVKGSRSMQMDKIVSALLTDQRGMLHDH